MRPTTGYIGCGLLQGSGDADRSAQAGPAPRPSSSPASQPLRGDGDVQAGFPSANSTSTCCCTLLAIAASNGAEPLVAGAGLAGKARDGPQQAIQRQGIVIAGTSNAFCWILRPANRYQLDQTLPVAGQHRAAARFPPVARSTSSCSLSWFISLMASQALL